MKGQWEPGEEVRRGEWREGKRRKEEGRREENRERRGAYIVNSTLYKPM